MPNEPRRNYIRCHNFVEQFEAFFARVTVTIFCLFIFLTKGTPSPRSSIDNDSIREMIQFLITSSMICVFLLKTAKCGLHLQTGVI